MDGVGGVQHPGPLGLDELGPAVVDVGGVWKPIPEWRCSWLDQRKNRVQKAWASSKQPNRSGTSGRCLRVLNWLSLEGLSLLVCGRLWLLVTPRSASRNATGLDAMAVPRSAWMVS
jgi:hypothetical protein